MVCRKVNVPWSELLHQAWSPHLAWRARALDALEVADFDETPESIC